MCKCLLWDHDGVLVDTERGIGRCAEVARRSATAGITIASLTWADRRIDLDLVLNNGAGTNFRQSIAANRSGERVEFFATTVGWTGLRYHPQGFHGNTGFRWAWCVTEEGE